MIDKRLEYLHNNPVEAGFVAEAHFYLYSSAIDYSGGKGLLEIIHASWKLEEIIGRSYAIAKLRPGGSRQKI